MYILDGRKLLSLPNLNSSPIEELGNWCQERVGGGPRASMRHSREVSMATL